VSTKSIFIEPSDVWLFRDGRPFAPNERGRAVSLFPPTPQTVQGTIRSARLAQSGASFTGRSTWPAEVGKPENFGALYLRGPLVAKRNGDVVQRFFALPEDVTRLQSGWHILSPSDGRFETNWQPATLRPLLPPGGSEPTKFDKGWLCEDGLLAYLKGHACGVHVHPTNAIFVHEPRFGVQVDSHPKRPMEGMLYQVEFVRLEKDVGLLVEVGGVNLESSGLLQLGGEARSGHYKTVTTGLDLLPAERLADGNKPLRFKLYLATPAIFGQGWLPAWIDAQTLTGKRDGVEVKLVAAAVGKAQPIGGRSIAEGDKQRPIRRAVAAGSVYLFETEASANDVLDAFDGQCVSDADAQIGFGLCYVGGW
jgi:CRISPR-associated protein Cmr3